MDDYVFTSRERDNKPLTRQQSLNILKDSAAAVGIKENVGTYTLRSTGDGSFCFYIYFTTVN